MRKQERIIVWPAYFDLARTRKDGRRVPKSLAVPSPKISEVKDAAEKLRSGCELVPNLSYPKTHWLKTGMLLLEKTAKRQNNQRDCKAAADHSEHSNNETGTRLTFLFANQDSVQHTVLSWAGTDSCPTKRSFHDRTLGYYASSVIVDIRRVSCNACDINPLGLPSF